MSLPGSSISNPIVLDVVSDYPSKCPVQPKAQLRPALQRPTFPTPEPKRKVPYLQVDDDTLDYEIQSYCEAHVDADYSPSKTPESEEFDTDTEELEDEIGLDSLVSKEVFHCQEAKQLMAGCRKNIADCLNVIHSVGVDIENLIDASIDLSPYDPSDVTQYLEELEEVLDSAYDIILHSRPIIANEKIVLARVVHVLQRVAERKQREIDERED